MLSIIIVKNTFYQILARIVTSGIGLLTVVIIARYLGVDAYGDYTKILAYVGTFYLFIDFGLNAIFLQRQEDNLNFRNFFYLRFVMSALAALIAVLISLALPYNPSNNLGFSPSVRFGILIFSLSIISQSLLLTSTVLFQRKLKYNFLLIANTIGSLVTLIFVIVFGYYSLPLYFIIFALVLGGFIGSIAALLKAGEKIFPFSFNLTFSKSILKQSLPLGLMLIFNFIYFRVDIFLLSIFQSSKDVGIYGISYKFFDFLVALPLFLSNTIYPSLLKQEKFPNASANTKKYLFLFFLFSLVVFIPFWFGGEYIYLIKKEFVPALVPFRILLMSLPFFFMTSILQWILIAKKEQKFLMKVYFFSMILNIILNLIFIPKNSYIAAAIITSVSEGLIFIFLGIKYFQYWKNTQNKI